MPLRDDASTSRIQYTIDQDVDGACSSCALRDGQRGAGDGGDIAASRDSGTRNRISDLDAGGASNARDLVAGDRRRAGRASAHAVDDDGDLLGETRAHASVEGDN